MSKKRNSRILEHLVERKLANSIEHAKKLVLAGEVFVDEVLCDKPNTFIGETAIVRLKVKNPYASRAGEKIAAAAAHFQISFADKIIIDVGASTGGFTDFMIHNGAKLVYAVDVGSNQLAWELRTNKRVAVLENRDIRQVTPDDLATTPSLATVDVSFISLQTLLPYVAKLLTSSATILALVKPNFELPRELVEEGGIVSIAKNQELATKNVRECLSKLGFVSSNPYKSPLVGKKGGNEEFFIYSTRDKQ